MLLRADGYIIAMYRMTGEPLADYFIGTFLLAAISVLAGEVTLHVLMRVNSQHIKSLDAGLAGMHELSLSYKRSGDEQSYRRANREANDAFGRVFFNMFTFSAASLWAAFMALAWMQTRFMNIEFPLPVAGISVGYAFTFLLMYVLARILGRWLRRLGAKP